ILREPKNALLRQYQALIGAEGVTLEFTDEGIEEIARIAAQVNERLENIGARRLHTVMTTLLEDILFELPERGEGRIVIGPADVRERLKRVVEDEDLRRYILLGMRAGRLADPRRAATLRSPAHSCRPWRRLRPESCPPPGGPGTLLRFESKTPARTGWTCQTSVTSSRSRTSPRTSCTTCSTWPG